MASFHSQQSGASAAPSAALKVTAPAPVPQPAPLPQGWIQLTDPEGRLLFHNFITGHTQYNSPLGGQGSGQTQPSASSGQTTPNANSTPHPVQAALHQILSSTDPKGGGFAFRPLRPAWCFFLHPHIEQRASALLRLGYCGIIAHLLSKNFEGPVFFMLESDLGSKGGLGVIVT